MRQAMSIDLDLCVGCKACVSACKEQWDSGPGAARDWVSTIETGKRGRDLAVTFYPGLCMQCEAHPCTVDCPTGATYADPKTGVVMVDADVCIGCGNCVSSCPYGARHVDPVKKIVEKCNLCAPFVARGEQPACVATCPAECRVFGDLDDPGSAVSRAIREKGAKPLVTAGVNVGPKATYAGEAHRERILAAGAVKQPRKSGLTRTWGTTLPAVRNFVPAVGLAFVGGGLLVNLKARADRVKSEEAGKRSSASTPVTAPGSLPRHRAGVRLLHWFNALSWLILVATGTGLMSAASFALFGAALPRAAARLLGGTNHLLRFHVLWGLLWAAVIVPMFLLFKKGPREVLAEVRLTRDDLAWLFTKPLAMAGFRKQPLPPQDKYNAGQKLFAILVLLATVLITASGLVMAFHLGSADVVAGAIVVHELAIALVLLGAAIHVTMAAVIAEERPALQSMITGRIDYLHAKHHSPKWVAELDARRSGPREGEKK
jgi:formate dehydrogenase gamma subunit